MDGVVESCGYSAAFGGVVAVGWIDLGWDHTRDESAAKLIFEKGDAAAAALICVYRREDTKEIGSGYLLFVEIEQPALGALRSLRLEAGERIFELVCTDATKTLGESEIGGHVDYHLKAAPESAARAHITALMHRPKYAGVDTFGGLPQAIHMNIDDVYLCPPTGLLLKGWLLDPSRQLARLRICCGDKSRALDTKTWATTSRSDVIEGFAGHLDFADEKCGFLAFVPGIYEPDASLYLEVETLDGRIAFQPVARPRAAEWTILKRLLESVEVTRDNIISLYDRILGPAAEAIGAAFLKTPPKVYKIAYGPEVPAPRASLVVTLYGRVDFLEYQLALFSLYLNHDIEIIYVLDDPTKRQETEHLAASAYAKFNRPFQLLALSHNVGFAPANNVGLSRARGRYIGFLNSDVFVTNAGWLDLLIQTLAEDPTAGVVGARLLYEDGTLQHDGCAFQRLPEFGDWPFPLHPRKGRLVRAEQDRSTPQAITGACMVLRASLARELGGFDEGYLIGDFEDADLCMRVAEKGLRCIVDQRVELYHLERQSQAMQPGRWRMNLTLFNAWRFQRRWSSHVA